MTMSFDEAQHFVTSSLNTNTLGVAINVAQSVHNLSYGQPPEKKDKAFETVLLGAEAVVKSGQVSGLATAVDAAQWAWKNATKRNSKGEERALDIIEKSMNLYAEDSGSLYRAKALPLAQWLSVFAERVDHAKDVAKKVLEREETFALGSFVMDSSDTTSARKVFQGIAKNVLLERVAAQPEETLGALGASDAGKKLIRSMHLQ